ncbi:NAD-dependent epimerase/dehydratase family protein [Paraburkholderia sp. DHOC27]|uniref:NAD-dependent epimerase/dehydratase family protein n=1 Tax=Paraburkholderia sp. DHOC27 TaxID=2303330 RepID=UPI0015F3001C|nr:NAD-dependent epimerase/dehydratase family protein [Paraburkholderia sp. DHOC27]
MKALITGGFGFIGAHLTNLLVSRGWHVTIVELKEAVPCVPLPPQNVTTVYGKYYDQSVLRSALVDVDVCFHLASSVGPANSNERVIFDIETNLIGTINLLDAVRASTVRRFIYLSSGGTVYGGKHSEPLTEDMHGSPTCSYGIVKKTVEYYLSLYNKLYGLEYNVLRLANPYGVGQRLNGNQGVIANFIGKIISNAPIEIWGDGSVIRDYIYISDAVEAIARAATVESKNELLNIGTGIGLSLSQIVQLLKNEFNHSFDVEYKPGRGVDLPVNILNIEKSRKLLDWTPTVDIAEGINRTVAWAGQQTHAINHLA